MPGKKCPKCGNLTLFTRGSQMICSTPGCGYVNIAPPNMGKGGRGSRCPRCGRFTVFNGVCNNPACNARTK